MTMNDNMIRDRLVDALDAEEAALPPEVTRRLVEVRRAARLKASDSTPKNRLLAWQPLVGASALGVLALAVFGPNLMLRETAVELGAGDTAIVTLDVSTADTLDVLGSSDDIEFYQSVDFLLWLEQQG